MKKAVITYNFGNYESMPEPLWITQGWDLIAFTDENTEVPKDWSRMVLPSTSDIGGITDFQAQSKRISNYVKFQPFKLLRDSQLGEYDMLIVVDANFQLAGNLDEACERLLIATADGCFLSHDTMDSCYDDIDRSVRLGKLDAEVAELTKKMFSESNVPKQNDHYCQTGFSIRRNTSGWKHFESIWWDSYSRMCNRDQPVFNALLNRFPVLDINVVPKQEVDPYLKYTKHSFEEIA